MPLMALPLKAGATVRPVWREERTGSILDIVHFSVG